jgi:RimJ/RimL family protein N-acetyltransferase
VTTSPSEAGGRQGGGDERGGEGERGGGVRGDRRAAVDAGGGDGGPGGGERRGGELVGSLGIQLRPYDVAELGMLVAAGWRGRGVGSGLLRAAIDWARQSGAHKVALQAWPHNEPALALYRKFGFAEEGRLRRHYRRRNGELWDAVVMGLVLDETSPGPPPALRGP